MAGSVEAGGGGEFVRGPAAVESTRDALAGDAPDDGGAADAEPLCDVMHEFARFVRGEELVDLGRLEASLDLPGRPRARRV